METKWVSVARTVALVLIGLGIGIQIAGAVEGKPHTETQQDRDCRQMRADIDILKADVETLLRLHYEEEKKTHGGRNQRGVWPRQ